MPEGYVIGHEPMGIVEEVGPEVTRVKKGDRVIIPFNVSCGECFFCKNQMESQCDNSNDNPAKDTGAYLGYSETYGGYPGGQAELLRVPYGNFMPFVVPEDAFRKNGTIQLIGVYGLTYNMFPPGDLFSRNITLKMGQAPVIQYMPELYRQIKTGELDTTDIITHRLPLTDAEHGYEIFMNKLEDCIKVVLKP